MKRLVLILALCSQLQAQRILAPILAGAPVSAACTDPGSMSATNLAAGFEADTGVTCSGACVNNASFTWDGSVFWNDISSNHNNIKSDSGTTPTYKTNVFGAHPAISFSASCATFASSINTHTAGNYYLVFQNNATGTAGAVTGGPAESLELGSGATKEVFVNSNNAHALLTGSAAQDTSAHLVTIHWDGTTITSVIDGVTDQSATPGANAPTANIAAFVCDSASGGLKLNAKVGAFYVYTANISGATDTANACYLKTKYGTP